MKNRRAFLLTLTSAFIALVVAVAPAIADELFGVITKADPETKKLTVLEKDTDKEVVVSTTPDTEVVGKKKARKIDFEKIAERIEKSRSKGGKGFPAKIEHADGVASKIYYAPKKQDAPAPPPAKTAE